MPTIRPLQQEYNTSEMIRPFDSKTCNKGTIKDNYEFLEVLGEGSFAKVFRCVEKDTGLSFAAKELDCHGDNDYKARIEQEVEILKDLRHKNIVTLHTTLTEGDRIYLVMELVDGGSLFDEIIHQTVYSEKQALRITKQLLKALEYLHNQRIVHRDIKPDNLLIQRSQDDGDVTIKVTDFGLAQRLPDNSDVITCEPSGAAMFLAPETILEEPIGCAVDMWSTGVILYLMLAGYPPFWSSSDEQLLLSILGGQYTMPSPYWDNVKSTTKNLVRSLIVQQPQDRLTATQALDHAALSDGVLQGRKISLENERKRDFLAVISGIRAMIKFKRANVKSVSRRLSERGDLKSPISIHHNHMPLQTELESVFE